MRARGPTSYPIVDRSAAASELVVSVLARLPSQIQLPAVQKYCAVSLSSLDVMQNSNWLPYLAPVGLLVTEIRWRTALNCW